MPLFRFKEDLPAIDPSVYIAPTATVIGRVRIGKNASVWFGSVLRGDSDSITVGEGTNIQDLTMCHADTGLPLLIGNRVTIGHRCIVHGCTIGDRCLIGMGAIVMNGARIGRGSIVAAGSVVLENTEVPPYSLVAGTPGKIKRTFENKEEMLGVIDLPAQIYMDKGIAYASKGLFSRMD